MNDLTPEPQADLIGYHLGLLDAHEAAQVARALQQSPDLRAQFEELVASLRPLEAHAVEAPGADLATRLIERACAQPMLRVHAGPPRRTLMSGESAPARDGPMISLKELVGLAAAVALFVALFVPGYQHARSAAMQSACLNNFRAIGEANASYAQANAGVLPFAGAPSGPWLATSAGGPAHANSRNPFLTLRLGFVDQPIRFICPARPGDRPMPRSQVARSNDFPTIHNISYSSQLLTAPTHAAAADPAMPVLADQNPRFEQRRFQPRTVSNSDSHGHGAGQNVLRVDGAAGWTNRAEIGPARDDIFKLADLSNYTGYERPQSNTDAFLVP